ncbi:hypothetical protein CFC21_037717, partial [Triticum aestivum]
MHENVCA